MTKGYSETIKYIFLLGIAIPAVFEMGRHYGFNKPMPREKLSERVIRATHLIFGIITLSLINQKIGVDLFEIMLKSKSLLLVLWLWCLFLLAIEYSKGLNRELLISNNAVERDGKDRSTEA